MERITTEFSKKLMKMLLTNIRMQLALGALALSLSLPASAVPIFTRDFSTGFAPGNWAAPGTGLVNDAGFTDSFTVSGLGTSIQTLGLTLRFSGGGGLESEDGQGTMTGVLALWNVDQGDLGYFTLDHLSYTIVGGDYIYTANVIGSFLSLNPNNTWSLALSMPPGSEGNTLTSWSLDGTSVPDGGTTIALLGLSVAGLSLMCLRRKSVFDRGV